MLNCKTNKSSRYESRT